MYFSIKVDEMCHADHQSDRYKRREIELVPAFCAKDPWGELSNILLQSSLSKLFQALNYYGYSAQLTNDDGLTCLHVCCTLRLKSTFIQQLIADGADINAQDSNGVTPLWTAIHFDQPTYVELLLQAGADPSIAVQWFDGHRYQAHDVAMLLHRPYCLVKCMQVQYKLCSEASLQFAKQLNLVENLGITEAIQLNPDGCPEYPLHRAAALNDIHAAKRLLVSTYDASDLFRITKVYQMHPLNLAAKYADTEMIKLLIMGNVPYSQLVEVDQYSRNSISVRRKPILFTFKAYQCGLSALHMCAIWDCPILYAHNLLHQPAQNKPTALHFTSSEPPLQVDKGTLPHQVAEKLSATNVNTVQQYLADCHAQSYMLCRQQGFFTPSAWKEYERYLKQGVLQEVVQKGRKDMEAWGAAVSGTGGVVVGQEDGQ